MHKTFSVSGMCHFLPARSEILITVQKLQLQQKSVKALTVAQGWAAVRPSFVPLAHCSVQLMFS